MSIITHTSRSSSLDLFEYRHGRSVRRRSADPSREAAASLRLAVLLSMPSVSHMRSRMTPLSFFDAFAYSSLNRRVI